MLLRIVPAERHGRHERGQPVAGLRQLARHLQLARANRPGVFAGPVDQQLIGDRLVLPAPAAGRQKRVAMAVAARAMNVERRPRVDPHLQAVAVFEPALAAPRRCFLPSTRTLNTSPSGLHAIRTSANDGSRSAGARIQLGQIQQPVRLIQLHAARLPNRDRGAAPARRSGTRTAGRAAYSCSVVVIDSTRLPLTLQFACQYWQPVQSQPTAAPRSDSKCTFKNAARLPSCSSSVVTNRSSHLVAVLAVGGQRRAAPSSATLPS